MDSFQVQNKAGAMLLIACPVQQHLHLHLHLRIQTGGRKEGCE